MRRHRSRALASLLAASALAVSACAGPIKSQGIGDTADHHYAIGMKLLETAGVTDAGDEFKEPGRRRPPDDLGPYTQAADEFERARQLAPNDPRPWEGLGLVRLSRNELASAEEAFKHSLSKNSRYVPAHLGLARVYVGMGKLDRARHEAETAVHLAPQDPRTHVMLGRVLLSEYDFSGAEQSFSRALEIAPADPAARREWDRSVKIRQAAPGTLVGKKIALADPVTRGELAALLATELGVETYVRKHRPEILDPAFRSQGQPGSSIERPAPTDVREHWARNAIVLVIRLDLMEPYPDGTFRPDEAMTRAALASVLEQVLVVVSNDPSLKTRYVGQPSPFPDVRSDHFAFNAIMVTTTRGLLEAEPGSGAFGLAKPVSGPEALLAMRKLAELF